MTASMGQPIPQNLAHQCGASSQRVGNLYSVESTTNLWSNMNHPTWLYPPAKTKVASHGADDRSILIWLALKSPWYKAGLFHGRLACDPASPASLAQVLACMGSLPISGLCLRIIIETYFGHFSIFFYSSPTQSPSFQWLRSALA